MKVVAESNWNWMLYQDQNEYILSVLCGGVGMFTLDIVLSEKEVSKYSTSGEKYIEKLAREISYSPNNYESRQIEGFHKNKQAEAAVKAWRANHAQ